MVDDRYRRRDEHGYGRDQGRGSYQDEFYPDRARYGAAGTANESTNYDDFDQDRHGSGHDRQDNGGFGRGYGQRSGGTGGEGLYGVHGPDEYANRSRYGRDHSGQGNTMRAGGDLYGRDRYPGNSSREGYAGQGERFAGGYDDYGRDYGRNLEGQAYGSNPRSAYGGQGQGYGSGSGFGNMDMGSGEHRGRGPRGYQRSDERIREDVSDRLSDDGMVDASDIEVTVNNAEVTLSGTVTSRDQKRRAEDIAEQVSAVKHVQNNLRVGQGTNAAAGRGTDMSGVSASASSGMSAGTSPGSGDTTASSTSRKT